MSDNRRQTFADSRQRTALATAAYEALKQAKRLSSHRLITYRCPRRCLLLDVLNLPQGVVLHQPAYKLPPAVNEAASSESGRVANTTDGRNHWQAQTFFAEDCANVSTNCPHVHQAVVDKTEIQADLDAGHTEVTIPRQGGAVP